LDRRGETLIDGDSTPALLEVGHIAKAHGIRGEVLVSMISNRAETRLAPGSVLSTPAGPMEVVTARLHQGRWIVAFTGISDRSSAEALRGRRLSAPRIEDEADTLWVHELIGAEVFDVGGLSHGVVAAIEAQPAADLLVLASGRLVPLNFVVGSAPGRVVVDGPPGLLTD